MAGKRGFSLRVGTGSLLAAVICGGCGDPVGRTTLDEPPPGSVSVPAGRPAYEYDVETIRHRTEVAMVLEEDLRIENPVEDPAHAFSTGSSYPRVASGPDGQIYVLDTAGARVQAFDPEGNFVRSIGGRGQGPGEFLEPTSIAIAGDRVLVMDWQGNRSVSVFASTGDFLEQIRLDKLPAAIHSSGENHFLVTARCADPTSVCVERVDLETREVRALAALPEPDLDRNDVFGAVVERFLKGQRASITTVSGGTFYAMAGDGYHVARVDPGEGVLWNLYVDWPASEVPDSDSDYISWWGRQVGQLLPDAPRTDWAPTTLDPLSMIRSDEEGNLYVFPSNMVRRDPEHEISRPRPVHVFSHDAELLTVGTIEMVPEAWQDVRNGKIYGARFSDDTLDWIVTRSRLVRASGEWPGTVQ